jgi:hypothetical protein
MSKASLKRDLQNVTKPIGGEHTHAAGSTSADAAALPAATSLAYLVQNANGTTGVKIHADDAVIGRTLYIINQVSNKILKIYPHTGGYINGLADTVAFSTGSGRSAILLCVATDNWVAWT